MFGKSGEVSRKRNKAGQYIYESIKPARQNFIIKAIIMNLSNL